MAPAASAPARTALVRRWRDWEANPVLVKELRARFRGARAFWLVSLAAAMVGWPTLQMVEMTNVVVPGSSAGQVNAAQLGKALFQTARFFETGLILLLAPALTFASISGEREHHTLDLLMATPLSAAEVVRGKLLAALAYLGLLVTGVVPVMSLAFTVGGVSWQELVRSQFLILVSGLSLASVGLWASAHARYSGRAAVIAYGAAGFLCFVPALFMGVGPFPAYLSPIVLPLVFEGVGGIGTIGGGDPLAKVFALLTQGLVILTFWHRATEAMPGPRRKRNRAMTAFLVLAWILMFLILPRLSGA